MNKINRVIFVDSTISHNELSEYILDTDLLLPAIKRGDLFQLLTVNDSIKTVVIIDGVFEQQASITHKEILWALSKHVVVVGLSSMGALRACELRNYGMIGYGNIFQRYVSGSVDGDDEVAVSYVSSMGTLNKTIALVNIRSTLEKLNHYDDDLIFEIKKINFKYRNWLSIEKVIPHEIYMELRSNYIDQKKADVVLYFQENYENRFELSEINVSTNMYILKKEIKYKYHGIINFIEHNLKKSSLISTQKIEANLETLACDIATYLELDECYIQNILSILNMMRNFSYCKKKLKNISDKIRREQSLYTSEEFLTFIKNKKIKQDALPAIFEGISKLDDYFMYQLSTG